ncbi:MAG: hypothetical protein AAGK25_06140 [Pseudomonadota bacterium]
MTKTSLFPPETPPCGNLFAQRGFVLPFVLMTLAAISLVAFSAYAALERSSAYMRALQDQARVAAAFQSAEAEATFRFLTSAAVPGGLRDGAIADLTSGLVLGLDDPNAPAVAADLWRGDGSVRRSVAGDVPVLVSYRDSGGLAAINLLREEKLITYFEVAGFAREDATRLAAELGDYMDGDKERRFLGAEGADYLLYQRPPPTDAALRHVLELTRLLSIPPDLGDRFWNSLMAITTLDRNTALIKPDFALPPLIGTLTEEFDDVGADVVSLATLTNPRPGPRARFLLTTVDQRGIYRIIEVEKSVNHLAKPFKRAFISAGPTAPTDGLADPANPETSSLRSPAPDDAAPEEDRQANNDPDADPNAAPNTDANTDANGINDAEIAPSNDGAGAVIPLILPAYP